MHTDKWEESIEIRHGRFKKVMETMQRADERQNSLQGFVQDYVQNNPAERGQVVKCLESHRFVSDQKDADEFSRRLRRRRALHATSTSAVELFM